ncbi:chitin synthase regulatory factor [Ceratobasidium sp. AG-Ba]|nr:chitin synthase regulatory factor [Ceratobasidium sp. AG-Ba]
MSARPDYFQDEYMGGQYPVRRDSNVPPTVPPLPPQYARAETLSPNWNDPMPAPRPQRIMSNVPDDSLEQSMQPSGFSMPVPSFAGGFAVSAPPPPPPPPQAPAGAQYGGYRQPTMGPPPARPVSAAYPGPGGWAAPPAPPAPQHQPTLPVAQFDSMSLGSPGPAPVYSPRQSSLMSPVGTTRPLSFAGSIAPQVQPAPTPAPPPAPSSPPPNFDEPVAAGGPPAIVAPMPTISSLVAAESRVTKPSHVIAWAKAVLALVNRVQPDVDPDHPKPLADPVLARLANVAIQHVTSFASTWPIGSSDPVPAYVAEALYLRGTLEASGAFPEKIPRDQRAAFRDFEASARQGYAPGWFKLGRDYESVKDIGHAREVFERGARVKETSCLYRLGMAHLLGQLGFPATPSLAVGILREAADLSTVEVPQPSYVFGMLLLGEFSQVQLPPALLAQVLPAATAQDPHPRASEARRRIERSAYLGFGPALYKIGWAYEHAKMGCTYDPLLSVQYYSAASQRGEGEADMALSKWFLCGSEGAFEKDENLAVVFAEKAANRGLASGMFAMGYYYEVGVGIKADRAEAIKWYQKAAAEGNTEAPARLTALSGPNAAPLSRAEHESLTDSRLVRKHTRAKDTAAAAGRVAQAKGEEERKAMAGAAQAAARADPEPAPSAAPASPQRRPGQMGLPGGGRLGTSPPRGQSPLRQGTGASSSPASPPRRTAASPQRPAAGAGAGRGAGRQQFANHHRYTLTDEGFQNPPASPPVSHQKPASPAPAPQSPTPATAAPAPAPAPTPTAASGKHPKKGPQTFAEMGFHSQPVEDKDCVIM